MQANEPARLVAMAAPSQAPAATALVLLAIAWALSTVDKTRHE